MASSTSVLSSKNVSGVQCVAPGCTNYFYSDVVVSFHRLPSDKQQLSRRLQSRKCKNMLNLDGCAVST